MKAGEKGTTEDEMIGWHHQLDGHEFEWRKRHNASWDPLDFGVNVYYSWVCYSGPFTKGSLRLGQCKAEHGSRTRL